jgi:hypothetical protein
MNRNGLNARRALLILVAAFAALLPAIAAFPSPASAGFWYQVSCVNPDGSAAPSQGWLTGQNGNAADISSAICGPGQPMRADQSDLSGAAGGSNVYLQYNAPGGSAIAGGQVDTTLSADGYGTSSTGAVNAVAEAGIYLPTSGSAVTHCVAWLLTCSNGSLDFSGVVNLPADTGGVLYAIAGCSGSGTCDANPHNNNWAAADVSWARVLLQNSESPTGTGFSGSAMNKVLRGTAHLVFTAAVPGGPGIYQVAVAIDGNLAWAATPDTNSGLCVPVGSQNGYLMFDYQQPCLDSEMVDASVPTAGLQDGRHELAVAVRDAAGGTSTVLDQTIYTFNPQVTPNPHGPHTIHARFVISWNWQGTITRLRSITVSHLPRSAGVSARCRGRRCPRLPVVHENAPRVKKLLHSLTGRQFHAGQRLDLFVTQRHHRPERIQLRFRSGRGPSARLLRH